MRTAVRVAASAAAIVWCAGCSGRGSAAAPSGLARYHSGSAGFEYPSGWHKSTFSVVYADGPGLKWSGPTQGDGTYPFVQFATQQLRFSTTFDAEYGLFELRQQGSTPKITTVADQATTVAAATEAKYYKGQQTVTFTPGPVTIDEVYLYALGSNNTLYIFEVWAAADQWGPLHLDNLVSSFSLG